MTHHNNHFKHAKSLPILYLCLLANILFVGIEAFIGWKSNSSGLISDAGHNLSDALGLALSIIAILLEKTGIRQNVKISRYITLLNGLLLMLAIGIIILESIDNILHPETLQCESIIYTAIIAIFINGLTAWLLMRNNSDNVNIKAAYLHAATDMLVSVGVVLSGIIIYFTGWNILDSLVALIISIIIAIPSLKLILNTLNLIKNS